MSKKIFISHAVNDRNLVEMFVDDLLNAGMDISAKDIFCSSLSGMGIPSGKNFIEHIKNQIQNPEVVIVFLSKSYIKSQFCMSELGATWALTHNMLPILVPPLTHADLKGVLTGIQVDRLNIPDELNSFMERLQEILNTDVIFSRWERKRGQFLEKLPEKLSEISYSDDVSFREYNTLQLKYSEAQQELTQLESIIVEKDRTIEQLKKCKDISEVNAIVGSTFKKEEDEFEILVKNVNSSFNPLPSIVPYVFYKERHISKVMFDKLEEKYLAEQALEAFEEQYLLYDEPYYSLNYRDKKITAINEAVENLEKFLTTNISEEFYNKLTDEDGFEPQLQNKRFWKKYFKNTTLL